MLVLAYHITVIFADIPLKYRLLYFQYPKQIWKSLEEAWKTSVKLVNTGNTVSMSLLKFLYIVIPFPETLMV